MRNKKTNRNISPKNVKNILYYLNELKFSLRQTAFRLQISRDTVTKYRELFKLSQLPWPLPGSLSEDELLVKLVPPGKVRPIRRVDIDFTEVHATMQKHRKRGATLMVLHEEWLSTKVSTDPIISYSQFTKRYNVYVESLQISQRHTHSPGEIAFADYSGETMEFINPRTGETVQVQIFLGVLGYSSYTYCEATLSQKSEDWNMSHARMFQYFDGVPHMVVHDNLKAGTDKVDRYAPIINRSFAKMCEHFNTQPFPARVYRPKDKPKAEGAVLLAQRWILFRLRAHKFFSLAEVNQAIAGLLTKLNHKSFQKLQGSRYSRFIEVDQPKLQPLPLYDYEYAYWGSVRAGLDYHVIIERHAYSVPYELRRKTFDYSKTSELIRLYHNNKLIATHFTNTEVDGTTTLSEHMPDNHRAMIEAAPERVLAWAEKKGKSCHRYLEVALEHHRIGYQLYRFFNGFKKYTSELNDEHLGLLCKYLLENSVFKLQTIAVLLKHKWHDLLIRMEQEQDASEMPQAFKQHRNVRGKGYYARVNQANQEQNANAMIGGNAS